jgi:rpsU-divergently transcribed protein
MQNTLKFALLATAPRRTSIGANLVLRAATPTFLKQLNHWSCAKASIIIFSQSHFFASMEGQKGVILDHSLRQVKEYGWSEDAIAAGVLSAGFPLAMVGLVTQQKEASAAVHLVMHYMEQCNCNLLQELERKKRQQETKTMSENQKLFYAVQLRLRMNIPHVSSKRWHEAMAIGISTPYVALETSGKLRSMAQIILSFAGSSLSEGSVTQKTTLPQEGALNALYIATELFMLTDSSADFVDTWRFLQHRLHDMEAAAALSSNAYSIIDTSSANRQEAVSVMAAVLTSLGGAFISVLSHSSIPNINLVKTTTESSTDVTIPSSHVDRIKVEDLPPFDNKKIY